MKNILVAIEFEETDQVLIAKASDLAKAFNSKLWLIHVSAPDPDFVGYDVGPQYIRDSRAEELRNEHKLIQKYSAALSAAGIDSEGLLIQGATIEMIIEEAEKLKVDLLVMGHHEHSFFQSLLRGSVSSKIMKSSKIPVLIVPFG